ncbi:hypothetical protein Hanom_Chr10g00935991 [Helianthus anomalus]
MVSFLLKTTQRRLQLEWPKEVVGFLEVRTGSQDLVNKIFNTDDAEFPKSLLRRKTTQLPLFCWELNSV